MNPSFTDTHPRLLWGQNSRRRLHRSNLRRLIHVGVVLSETQGQLATAFIAKRFLGYNPEDDTNLMLLVVGRGTP